jgi:hypothetical protein
MMVQVEAKIASGTPKDFAEAKAKAPARAPSPYLRFCSLRRAALKADGSDLKATEVKPYPLFHLKEFQCIVERHWICAL